MEGVLEMPMMQPRGEVRRDFMKTKAGAWWLDSGYWREGRRGSG